MSTSEPSGDVEAVSAAEANRGFSRLLRGVREGRSFVVTSHGRPVARLGPCDEVASDPRVAARLALVARLQGQSVTEAPTWTRDDLHAR